MNTQETKYLNRELSWIEFNRRVLNESLRKEKPLLDRLKFMAIVNSNFDEFFMVRVASLKSEYHNGNYTICPSKMSPLEQLNAIYGEYRRMLDLQYDCFLNDILPGLETAGIRYLLPENMTEDQVDLLRSIFLKEYFPLLTPVRVSESEPMMRAGNMRIHAGFRIREHGTDEVKFSVVQIPTAVDRIVALPSPKGKYVFTTLEHLVVMFATHLFSGYEVLDHAVFRITRDADFAVDETRDGDFVEAMEQVLNERSHSEVVRLSCAASNPDIVTFLADNLELRKEEIFEIPNPLDIGDFMDIAFLPGFEALRAESWKPVNILPEDEEVTIWDWIKEQDRLLHHPFETFSPVIKLIQAAAEDPQVLAIKMTLYRTSGNSPIIPALEAAAKSGKQVTVLVELKARFDEARNIQWADRLEKAGVIVVYGIAELKVHAKALNIIRKEEQGIVRYLHLGTGNYNDKTAKLYTDLGLMTVRNDLNYEAAQFFNSITGYSAIPNLNKLIMAPHSLKPRLLQLIEREIEKHTPESPGSITAKINALADTDIIDALYRASKAGVVVRLNIRGICMLKPGVPGLSENITVRSIVDRYLEHTRTVIFGNGGNREVYISSADWMPRNLERRVELLVPVEDRKLVKQVSDSLEIYLRDNVQSWQLHSDGSYTRVPRGKDNEVHAQREMQRIAEKRFAVDREESGERVFKVRRKPPKAK